MNYGDLSDEIVKLLSVDASSFLQWLGLVVLVLGGSTLIRSILTQLPAIPLECAMRKAVGFHPSCWSFTPCPPLSSITSFIQNKV